MDAKLVKTYYDTLHGFFKKSVGDDHANLFMNELLLYSLYLAGADKKFSEKEINYIQSIVGTKLKKNLAEIYQKMDWVAFVNEVPKCLMLLLNVDKKQGSEYEDSISFQYMTLFYNFGDALLEIDGKTELEKNAFIKYIGFLFEHCSETLKPETQGSSKKKTETAPKKDDTPAKSETKQSPQAKTEKAKDRGKWIKASNHVPSGNFLDDVFRHTALSHEDRVQIWTQITGASLPCVKIEELDFEDWVEIYTDTHSNGINDLYEHMEEDGDKPIYYYTSGIIINNPDNSLMQPGGILMCHRGLAFCWDDQIILVAWDRIHSVSIPHEESLFNFKSNSPEIKLKANDKNFKLLNVDLAIDQYAMNGVNSDKKGKMTICFPQNSSIPELVNHSVSEVDNFASMLRTRIAQTEPQRNAELQYDLSLWYNYITEQKAKELCEDYLKESESSATVPQMDSRPAKTETKQKPQAKTEKVKAKETEPSSEPVKLKPAPSTKNSPTKGKPAIQIPTSGPTTMLAFWEALKPFLAQMRHQEFDKTELKETDIHNAKATVILGAYNSIMIRKSQNVLRLELYINTETEAGNLQIFDHIQKNVKIPSALKGQVEFNRKEGRHGQRIYVNFEGFELSERSCWAKYIELIISVADDFFDALEKPMKELVG